MIISASRRTDIPAFYAEWFYKRIECGYCVTRNPYNPKQVYRVSLNPKDVDAIVFWSKNPAPIIPGLSVLDDLGYKYYFQFTLNGYPDELEANLPSLKERIKTFKTLSDMVGPKRVIWRYDPIIISTKTDYDFHRRKFSEISGELAGKTARVMVSFVEYYRKTIANLKKLEPLGYEFDTEAVDDSQSVSLLGDLAKTASMAGIEMLSCASAHDFSSVGIKAGRCIDAELINGIWGLNLSQKKDPGQREFCQCAVSRDIGVNDTCIHNCPYCYATKNHSLAVQRYKEHNPDLEYISGG